MHDISEGDCTVFKWKTNCQNVFHIKNTLHAWEIHRVQRGDGVITYLRYLPSEGHETSKGLLGFEINSQVSDLFIH